MLAVPYNHMVGRARAPNSRIVPGGTSMNRIQDLQAAIRALEEAASAQLDGHPGAWDRWYTDHGCKPARLEFPLGELFNERIRGSVWA